MFPSVPHPHGIISLDGPDWPVHCPIPTPILLGSEVLEFPAAEGDTLGLRLRGGSGGGEERARASVPLRSLGLLRGPVQDWYPVLDPMGAEVCLGGNAQSLAR